MINFDFDRYQSNLSCMKEADISGFSTESGVSLYRLYINGITHKGKRIAFLGYNDELYRFTLRENLTVECADKVVERVSHGVTWYDYVEFEFGCMAFWDGIDLELVKLTGTEIDVAFYKFLCDLQSYLG